LTFLCDTVNKIQAIKPQLTRIMWTKKGIIHCQILLLPYITGAPFAATEVGRDLSCSKRKERRPCPGKLVEWEMPETAGMGMSSMRAPGTGDSGARERCPVGLRTEFCSLLGPVKSARLKHTVWPSFPATRLLSSPTIYISRIRIMSLLVIFRCKRGKQEGRTYITMIWLSFWIHGRRTPMFNFCASDNTVDDLPRVCPGRDPALALSISPLHLWR